MKTCHFIGIGGIGMSGLAKLLIEKQIPVTGSDLSKTALMESLENQGAKVYVGQKEQHINPDMTVVYNTSIKENNPEYLAATKLKCKMLHRSDLLLHLMKGFKTLSVTGTHGKTITSSLLASVLVEGGLDPAFAIGGILLDFNCNARHGQGEYFVAEADESDNTFLKYDTFGGILTNIGLDHLDTFQNEQKLIDAFQTFADNVTEEKHFFWCGDDPRLAKLSPAGISYGKSKTCDWQLKHYRQEGWSLFFDATYQGKTYPAIEVALIGEHQALNALAVFGLALTLGVKESAIRKALRTFSGTKRRCEKMREENKILLLDDYAHHTTEIKTTLQGIRKAIGQRRLIAVFQPHRYTRTRDCLGHYKEAFQEADLTIVTDIYSAGEDPIPSITPQKILEEIEVPSSYFSREELAKKLPLLPHDVVVSLGAGDITHLSSEISLEGKTLKVGVVFGGCSVEHEISIKSAAFVKETLDRNPYEVIPFKISKEGNWAEDKRLSPEILKQLLSCDIVFPVLHGRFGEDGTIQGFFEMLGLPYVGCDHSSSALCMDKAHLKHLMLRHGIRTSPFIDFGRKESHASILKSVREKLTYPVFVKGVHLGSAISVQKVEKEELLASAIEEAFRYDHHLLIENGLEMREIEFAVFGNEQITTFPPGEVCSEGKVYDYNAKYIDDWVRVDPIAKLPKAKQEEGMQLAKRAYQIARCKGFARVDFFLDKSGTFWFNEINPIPGFTEISLYPQICAANGFSAEELLDQLLILGLHRHRKCKHG